MKTKKLLFLLGVCLLSINILGLFKSLRNEDIYLENKTSFEKDITLTFEEVKKQIIKRSNESNKEYAFRLNKVVNNAVAHYWIDEGIDRYHLRIPIWENYLMYLASFIRPQTYLKYEFVDYKKALERGVGLCSQQAIIVSELLNENDVNAELLGLEGHVVVRAQLENETWYILDSDYGIIIPHDISEIERNQSIVEQYYLESRADVERMVDVYGPEGNQVWYPTLRSYIEEVSYVAIWILPLCFCIPYYLYLLKPTTKEK